MPAVVGDRLEAQCEERRRGFTFVELLLVMLIVGTMSAMAIPRLARVIEHARVARAIADIRAIQGTIDAAAQMPGALGQVGFGGRLDPWGRPYVYRAFALGQGPPREDQFSVPLNSEYDLYSPGPDGAPGNLDDVIRANDGGYIGRASLY
jgi:general secretion pathway protein G